MNEIYLKPGVVRHNGVNFAPKTLAKQVYMPDGRDVEEVLEDYMLENRKIILNTKTEFVTVMADGMRIFDIPFPINNYDVSKFPILILVNDRIVPTNMYSISNEQIIFEPSYKTLIAGDIITFIFHYNTVLLTEGIDAASINGTRIFVSLNEPVNKINGDTWVDLRGRALKIYNGAEWYTVIQNTEVPKFNIKKSSNTITTNTRFVNITIPDFNKETDLLLVFENSTYIEEGEDYEITPDNRRIEHANNKEWKGGSEEITFNFVVIHNIIVSENNEPIAVDYSIEKSQILNTLGISEDQLDRMKLLIGGK